MEEKITNIVNGKSLVSVIVPCYNMEKYILESLASVKNQTYHHWECIIVDDGSKDGSARVIKDFIVGDSRFKYIYEENRGVAAARNNAIKASNGKYILPLDPDDIIDKEYMEKAVSFLDSHCDYSIYYGACLRFGEGIRPYNWGILYSGYKELLKVNSIYNAAVFRRADFDKSGGYNESIPSHEDWEFYVRLLYHNDKVYQTDDVVFYYRQVQASRNSHTSRKYRKAFPLIISLNKQIYAEYGVSNKWYKRLYYKLRDKNK